VRKKSIYIPGLFNDQSALWRAKLLRAEIVLSGMPKGKPGIILIFENKLAAECVLAQITSNFLNHYDFDDELAVSFVKESNGTMTVFIYSYLEKAIFRAGFNNIIMNGTLKRNDYTLIQTPIKTSLSKIYSALINKIFEEKVEFWLGGGMADGEILYKHLLQKKEIKIQTRNELDQDSIESIYSQENNYMPNQLSK
jgi:hypothetical protein